ncbi:YibE/F family protein [Candidatus Parcubacteria bacterium]|nr:YibE/F family protein [Patescibacteria group bacterium]MBU4309905.1 YibE/F family protein [Patescibacteria group bacterium]MBU4432535.1 YibE/F family protein [Patescibacteria group bacterium]MBU4577830.1 YibE/F family protein [Patescibacteria group bacterium]MCG2696891.1 YibE/F family protein [Candidatus Parcubacteria bacterium]
MNYMFRKILLISILILTPFLASAEGLETSGTTDVIFKARVTEILQDQNTTLPDGIVVRQQNVKLKGLNGDFVNKEVVFTGIGDFDAVNKNIYEVGDKVLAVASYDAENNVNYYITDYVRNDALNWLFGLFVLTLLLVGRWKGLRSIISLVLSFLVIIKYIIPQILDGADPIIVTLIGSLVILLAVIYFTEGFNKVSHIATVSMLLSLSFAIFLSWFFVEAVKLSGFASEEMSFLVTLSSGTINFKGLLLAGIIIGFLGVLDDVVISQIATVEQLLETDPMQSRKALFKKAHKVGIAHISSMTNTLFLAYAGASLPLLVLFSSGQSAFTSFADIINNESIAEEIVRTLTGSVGLILAVPISTWIAVRWLSKR